MTANAWPAGATWWRCALQVAPFQYLATNNQQDKYGSETAYNSALIEALTTTGIQAVGFADHWRVRSCEVLQEAVTHTGIVALPGFEATTKDGLHVLVHFDPQTEFAEIERRINECGVDATTGTSDAGNLFFEDMLDRATGWGAVCTAAHVTMDAGLLKSSPAGRRRQEMWACDHLHAVALSVPVPPQERQILKNTDPQYRREHPPAVIYAADVAGGDDAAKECAATWLKMASPTAKGIDLAYRSPDTRVSTTDPRRDAHLTIQSIRWTGGFLDDVNLAFNPDLNVLIGGRGTGKSTVVESVRAALGQKPLTAGARAHHEEMISESHVLGRGTKIELVLGCVSPRPHQIRVERLLPSPPLLYDTSTGERVARTTEEVAAGLDVYGQRELAEVADDGELRTSLLRRFLPQRPDVADVTRLAQDVEATRAEIIDTVSELQELDQELSALPGLEERLRMFREAGVAAQLDAQARHQTEGTLVDTAQSRAMSALQELDELDPRAWFEDTFLDNHDESKVGDPTTVERIRSAFDQAELATAHALASAEDALRELSQKLEDVNVGWQARTVDIETAFNRIQRELETKGANAAEYLSVLRRTEDLRLKRPKRERLVERLAAARRRREDVLIELENAEAEEVRRLQRVAQRVSSRLDGLVRVTVTAPDDRSSVVAHLRGAVGGRLDKVEAWIGSWSEFTVRTLAELARSGIENFASVSGVPLDQAQRLTAADERVWLEVEEIQLTPSTEIELNVSSSDAAVWRTLTRLSTGQKATALLLLLLLEEKGPLVIDQPEDDLDNQFIFAGVVPRLRALKGTRQLIFSTHNANIPVLGDADLIAAMTVEHEATGPSGRSLEENRGSIDEPPVRELVEELLEGGREAFEIRRYRYGF